MNIQFQITPINSLRPSEVLDFGSRHGIYKLHGATSEFPYYLFLGNCTYHISHNNRYRHSQDLDSLRSGEYKYEFITDIFTIRDGKITFELPVETSLNLKDNPPNGGLAIEVDICGSKEVMLVPYNKEQYPLCIEKGNTGYSILQWGVWLTYNYNYRILGRYGN
jgi:hypothetical protein